MSEPVMIQQLTAAQALVEANKNAQRLVKEANDAAQVQINMEITAAVNRGKRIASVQCSLENLDHIAIRQHYEILGYDVSIRQYGTPGFLAFDIKW